MKTGKLTPIRVVKWFLNYSLFFAVPLLVLLTFYKIYLNSRGGYTSIGEWPVKILFGYQNHIPLTLVDIHRSAEGQILAEAISSRTFLQMVAPVNALLIGFDAAWILVTYGTSFLILYLLRKIVIHMESNDFFDSDIPAYMRMLGWTFIGASLMKTLLTYLYGLYAAALISGVPAALRATMVNPIGKPEAIVMGPLFDLSPNMLITGVIMFILAVAFQRGVDLKQEQSLTV